MQMVLIFTDNTFDPGFFLFVLNCQQVNQCLRSCDEVLLANDCCHRSQFLVDGTVSVADNQIVELDHIEVTKIDKHGHEGVDGQIFIF